MTQPDAPAFPSALNPSMYPGLTKREYFAAQLMDASFTHFSDADRVGIAVRLADMLIDALNATHEAPKTICEVHGANAAAQSQQRGKPC